MSADNNTIDILTVKRETNTENRTNNVALLYRFNEI
uniref:Uncharacterized protein n=1 Tax=viral metagenome TaxID=1070528 RepID=A0A6C0JE38_9ZZZZ